MKPRDGGLLLKIHTGSLIKMHTIQDFGSPQKNKNIHAYLLFNSKLIKPKYSNYLKMRDITINTFIDLTLGWIDLSASLHYTQKAT